MNTQKFDLENSINPGDVIIYGSSGVWWDRFINIVSRSTHVSYAISESQVIQADNRGVVVSDFDPKWVTKILRIKGMTDELAARGTRYGMSHLGDKYSVWTAIKAGILRLLGLTEIADNVDQNWDCSEYVASILRYGIGIPFVPRISLMQIVPDDFETGINEINKNGGIS